MYLYLVRHGQSEGNVLKTFHGQIDYPLTELGREQARQAADKLRSVPFQRCCSSDLCRAWDTAQTCLEGRGIVPEPCPALREQNVGDIEGLTWKQMEQRFPEVLHPYINDWFHMTPPGGESPDEMIARVAACVDGIIARGEDTLIAAHNGSLSLVLLHLKLVKQEELLKPDWFFTQGTYSAIQIEDGAAKLICFNR